MNRYKVRVYEVSVWGFFTQADHFNDYYIQSQESLMEIAKRLAREGSCIDGLKWIMPASILTVEMEPA